MRDVDKLLSGSGREGERATLAQLAELRERIREVRSHSGKNFAHKICSERGNFTSDENISTGR